MLDRTTGYKKTIIANEYISDGFIDVTDKYANEGKDKGYDYANDGQ